MSQQKKPDNRVEPLLKRFIDLANQMREEGVPVELVNAGLMFASCTYATYFSAGNEGYLEQSGVEKVMEDYRRKLESLQKVKKAQVNPDGKG